MCTTLKNYLSVLADRKDIIMTFLGFVFCGYLYNDFKTFYTESIKIQQDTVIILNKLDERISRLEQNKND